MDIKTKVTIVFGPDAKPSFFHGQKQQRHIKTKSSRTHRQSFGHKREKPLRHVVQNNRYTIHPSRYDFIRCKK